MIRVIDDIDLVVLHLELLQIIDRLIPYHVIDRIPVMRHQQHLHELLGALQIREIVISKIMMKNQTILLLTNTVLAVLKIMNHRNIPPKNLNESLLGINISLRHPILVEIILEIICLLTKRKKKILPLHLFLIRQEA